MLKVVLNKLSGIKEHYLDRFAERFQTSGFAAIVFDNRCWGASDGSPRHHTEQYQQVQDTHDVIYYATSRGDVDPSRIALWGSSFSGGVAIMVGAVDPRVKLVVVQVPLISGYVPRMCMPPDLLAKIFSDRGATNAQNPTYVPIWPETLDEAKQFPNNPAIMGTVDSYEFSRTVEAMGQRKENKITLQTLFHLIRAEPSAYTPQISEKPFFMAVALRDSLIDSKRQQEAFEQAGEPKELLALDCGHFDVYDGKFGEESINAQIAFLKKYL